MVDWNGDGLLDILISTEYAKYDGGAVVKLFLNEETATEYSFADSVNMTTSDGQNVSLYERTNICVADLNYDGLQDLILGDGIADYNGWNCNIYFFENTGTATEPSLKTPVKLQKKDGTDIRIRYDLKPYVTDWNEDGGLDLLLGHLDAENGIDLYLGDVMVDISQKEKPAYTSMIDGYSIVRGQVSVTVTQSNNHNITITVISLNGRSVYRKSLANLSPGMQTVSVDLNSIPAGVYFLHCNSGSLYSEKIKVVFSK